MDYNHSVLRCTFHHLLHNQPIVMRTRPFPRSFALLLAVALALTGCAVTTNKSSITELTRTDSEMKIVLMPLDVELSLLTAGGLHEPRADWTSDAMKYMTDAIMQQHSDRSARLVNFQNPADNPDLEEKLLDIERLHSAVGSAILLHQITKVAFLPAKKDTFDWTLGKEISVLREQSDADYALFVFVRDSYSSAGRVMAQVAAAAFGFGMAGGQQNGFASLVDLNTGNIVWFNHLMSTTGDLRNPEAAAKTVERLLDGLPG